MALCMCVCVWMCVCVDVFFLEDTPFDNVWGCPDSDNHCVLTACACQSRKQVLPFQAIGYDSGWSSESSFGKGGELADEGNEKEGARSDAAREASKPSHEKLIEGPKSKQLTDQANRAENQPTKQLDKTKPNPTQPTNQATEQPN